MIDRLTLLKISIAGDKMRVICTYCGDAITLPHGVNFKPYSEFINGRSVLIKNPKKLIKDFLEKHYGMHTDKGVKWNKEKAA